MWGPYPSRLDNVMMRSFAAPGTIRGNWWGGYVASRRAKADGFWEQVLSGGVNSSYYFAYAGAEGCLAIDRTPVKKMGLGILYSMPSEHALTIDTRFGTPGSCRDALLRFCDETGIPGFFYSEKQVVAGKLDADGVRVLFLPQTLCLGAASAASLRRWVEAGGTLIADQQTGLRNERGAAKWRSS